MCGLALRREMMDVKLSSWSFLLVSCVLVTSKCHVSGQGNPPDVVQVKENAPIGTEVLQLQTEQPASSFHIVRQVASGVNPASGAFAVGTCSGVIRTTEALDRETVSEYSLTVGVVYANESDYPAQVPYNAMFTVRVVVEDVNDNAPQCAKSVFRTHVPMNTAIGEELKFIIGVVCVDNDMENTNNSRLSWEVINGNGSAYFAIRRSDGIITLTRPLSDPMLGFTMKLDVKVSDSGLPSLSNNVELFITLVEANFFFPAFNDSTLSFSVSEDGRVGDVIGRVQATDGDAGQQAAVTYQIASLQSSMQINTTSGDIVLSKPLDHESVPIIRIIVIAADSAAPGARKSTPAGVVFNVTDANEAPVITPIILPISVKEDSVPGFNLTTVSCTDEDTSSSNLSITALSTDLPGVVEFDHQSKQVQLTGLVDLENVSSFNITILCREIGASGLTDIVTVSVSVVSTNDHAPIFSQPDGYNFSISENASIGFRVGQLVATDNDIPRANVTYRVQGCVISPCKPFNVAHDTGVVSVTATLDYEITPIYTLVAVASDGGNPSHATAVCLAIEVQNVNDNSPTFTQSAYKQTIVARSAIGTSVLPIQVKDADEINDQSNNQFTCSVHNTSAFAFHSSSLGLLLVVNTHLGAGIHNFQISCHDANPRHVSYADVTVHVVNNLVNNDTPRTNITSVNFTLVEDVPLAALLTTLHAVDSDEGATGEVRYEIVNCSVCLEYFNLNLLTGDLTLIKELNYASIDMYNASIRVFDNAHAVNLPQRFILVPFQVRVQDVAEPYFPKATYVLSALEGKTNVGQLVGYAVCLDASRNNTAVSSYTISRREGNSDLFMIGSDGNITTTGELDVDAPDATRRYVIGVMCQMLTSTAATLVTIDVQPVNEFRPRMRNLVLYQGDVIAVTISNLLTVIFPETTPAGTFLTRANIVDEDGPDTPDGQIHYIMEPSIFCAQNTAIIHPTLGQIYLTKKLPRTLSGACSKLYSYSLRVRDGSGLAAKHNYSVNLEPIDVNVPPVLNNHSPVSLVVRETEPVGQTITKLFCTDSTNIGINADLSFKIVSGNDAGVFEINSTTNLGENTGSIHIARKLYDLPAPTYRLEVECRDSGRPSYSDMVIVNIKVQRENLFAPVFTASAYTGSVLENCAPGTSVLQVSASDPDFGIHGETTVYLMGSTSSKFAVNSTTGVIVTLQELDREQQAVYNLTIFASDGHGHRNSTTVMISVTDVNDNRPYFLQSNYTASLMQDVESNFIAVRVTAVDDDLEANARITYSMSPASRYVSVDQSSGIVQMKERLPLGTTSLVFTMFASDADGAHVRLGGNTTVTLNVIDSSNVTVPKFDMPLYGVNISERHAPMSPQLLADVSSTLIDGGSGNGNVSPDLRYRLIDTSGKFIINATSGAVYLVGGLDYESAVEYTVYVQVSFSSDPALWSAIRSQTTVLVTVLDINDNSPLPTRLLHLVNITWNTPVGSTLARVQCADSDAGGKGPIRYTTSANEAGLVTINGSSGNVMLAKSVNNTLQEQYNVTVICSDNGLPSRHGYSSVVINVEGINHHSPHFSSAVVYLNVSESLQPSQLIHSSKLVATDPDVGSYGQIVYSITGGSGKDLFKISNGSLMLISALDRETTENVSLTIEAADMASNPKHSQITVLIHILDANDHVPICLQQPADVQIISSTAVGQPIFQVSCTDSDDEALFGRIRYSFSANQSTPFSIDKSMGAIIVVRSLTPADRKRYVLRIVASDIGNQTALVNVVIRVIGRPPMFISPSSNLPVVSTNLSTSMHVNSRTGHSLNASLIKLHAIDPDYPTLTGNVIYELRHSANTPPLFFVSECTGLIMPLPSVVYGGSDEYYITVTAYMRGQSVLSRSIGVVIRTESLHVPTVPQAVTMNGSVITTAPQSVSSNVTATQSITTTPFPGNSTPSNMTTVQNPSVTLMPGNSTPSNTTTAQNPSITSMPGNSTTSNTTAAQNPSVTSMPGNSRPSNTTTAQNPSVTSMPGNSTPSNTTTTQNPGVTSVPGNSTPSNTTTAQNPGVTSMPGNNTPSNMTTAQNPSVTSMPGNSTTSNTTAAQNPSVTSMPGNSRPSNTTTAQNPSVTSMPGNSTPSNTTTTQNPGVTSVPGNSTPSNTTTAQNPGVTSMPGNNTPSNMTTAQNPSVTSMPGNSTPSNTTTAQNPSITSMPGNSTPFNMTTAQNPSVTSVPGNSTPSNTTTAQNPSVTSMPGNSTPSDTTTAQNPSVTSMPGNGTSSDVTTAQNPSITSMPGNSTPSNMTTAQNPSVTSVPGNSTPSDTTTAQNPSITSVPGNSTPSNMTTAQNPSITSMLGNSTPSDMTTAQNPNVTSMPGNSMPSNMTGGQNPSVTPIPGSSLPSNVTDTRNASVTPKPGNSSSESPPPVTGLVSTVETSSPDVQTPNQVFTTASVPSGITQNTTSVPVTQVTATERQSMQPVEFWILTAGLPVAILLLALFLLAFLRRKSLKRAMKKTIGYSEQMHQQRIRDGYGPERTWSSSSGPHLSMPQNNGELMFVNPIAVVEALPGQVDPDQYTANDDTKTPAQVVNIGEDIIYTSITPTASNRNSIATSNDVCQLKTSELTLPFEPTSMCSPASSLPRENHTYAQINLLKKRAESGTSGDIPSAGRSRNSYSSNTIQMAVYAQPSPKSMKEHTSTMDGWGNVDRTPVPKQAWPVLPPTPMAKRTGYVNPASVLCTPGSSQLREAPLDNDTLTPRQTSKSHIYSRPRSAHVSRDDNCPPIPPLRRHSGVPAQQADTRHSGVPAQQADTRHSGVPAQQAGTTVSDDFLVPVFSPVRSRLATPTEDEDSDSDRHSYEFNWPPHDFATPDNAPVRIVSHVLLTPQHEVTTQHCPSVNHPPIAPVSGTQDALASHILPPVRGSPHHMPMSSSDSSAFSDIGEFYPEGDSAGMFQQQQSMQRAGSVSLGFEQRGDDVVSAADSDFLFPTPPVMSELDSVSLLSISSSSPIPVMPQTDLTRGIHDNHQTPPRRVPMVRFTGVDV